MRRRPVSEGGKTSSGRPPTRRSFCQCRTRVPVRKFRRCGAGRTQVSDGYRMSSAPGVPSVEVGASRLGGCEQALTAGALKLLAALHRTFGPRRAELAGSRVVRYAKLSGRRCPTSWPGRRTCGRATGGRPRWPRAWSIARSRSPAPADREMVINAVDCGAKIFMADFEDSNAPMSDNLVTGQLNLRNASRRRYRRCSPDSAASRMPGEQPATSSPPGSEPAAAEMADALDGPRQAGLAHHPDGRFDLLAPFAKEYAHARRLPAGL